MDLESVREVRRSGWPSIDSHHHSPGVRLSQLVAGVRLIKDGGRAEVRHVEVQVTIAVHVGQGHRSRPTARTQPGHIGDLLKTTRTLIEPQAGASAQLIDQQVGVSVPIHIGKGRSRRIVGS